MSKVHRNDPCPCGSGRKYKQCCLPAERERARGRAANRELVQRAVDWLAHRHGDAVARWVEDVWFDGVSEEERKGLATADPALRRVHDVNVLERLVAEGEFAGSGEADGEDGESRRVLDLVLGELPDLSEAQREWLAQLADAPLRLYRVTRCEPGEAFWLEPYPENGEAASDEPIRIGDRWTSRMLEAGDVAGLRLVRNIGDWETSGAVYYIPAEYVEALLSELDGKTGADYSQALTRYWLGLVAAHV